MQGRCRNCGKIITMSNISVGFFNAPGVCRDCNEANTGFDFAIMLNRLAKEKEIEDRRLSNIRTQELMRQADKRREDRLLENRYRPPSNYYDEEQAKKFASYLKRINSPEHIEKEKLQKEKNERKEQEHKEEKERKEQEQELKDKERRIKNKENRELWVYLLKTGKISAFDDIELDETGATYTIIPMGKADHCPAALKYREENKIDDN